MPGVVITTVPYQLEEDADLAAAGAANNKQETKS
jgi:hypothetical protein